MTRRHHAGWLLLVAWLGGDAGVFAQEHVHPPPGTNTPDHEVGEEHSVPAPHGANGHQGRRALSGTAWGPDDTPMPGIHMRRAGWDIMLHGQLFAQFLYESGEIHRASHQAGSINWGMAMADRPLGRGRLLLRAMASAEPWTIAGCGYPDLLATGERCDGDSIHDRQHPHDLAMELAAEYARPVGGGWRWHVYGGPVGEPALGPTAFLHRWSARGNPVAPISHHWIDSTHVTFGVVTSGVSSTRWRMEGSVFNGREPDERRVGLEHGPWNSAAARLSFTPSARWALQTSAGRLTGLTRQLGREVDAVRVTASAAYHRIAGLRSWATMLAWGVNHELGVSSHALLVESTRSVRDADWVFGRIEINGKPAHDLHVHEATGVFTVGKIQAGYVRRLGAARGVDALLGVSVSGAVLPAALTARYGGGVVPGVGVFLLVGPTTRHD